MLTNNLVISNRVSLTSKAKTLSNSCNSLLSFLLNRLHICNNLKKRKKFNQGEGYSNQTLKYGIILRIGTRERKSVTLNINDYKSILKQDNIITLSKK